MDLDLSVSEISGGDDSQLPGIPELDTKANDLFSKSRFTSPTKGLKLSTDQATPSCSSFMDSSNKENVSTSKSEVQKLSMEPLQMKRKKTGGYNLRKSLAWNKAFFTDEGVLDPTELSMISGTFSNASGGGLCSIEERRTPQSSNSLRNVASSSLKSIKKNMCKEISATSSKEDREKSSCEVFATQNGRTSSMGGICSRPLFSTSLKRPANINVSKAATKESKLPKFQVSKSSSGSRTTSKSTLPGASSIQNKKISEPVSIQRKYGQRSSLRNARNGQKTAKDDSIPPDLPLASHSARDADKSTLNLKLSNSSSLIPIRKNSNTSSKVIPVPVVPYSSTCSSQGRDGSAPPSVSLLQNTFTSGRSLQRLQIQTMKPSGLRMPSPSLGFFRQSKASETHRLSQRNSDSSVHMPQKSGDLRPPCAVGGLKINDITAVMNGRDISTRLECSGAKGIKPCLDDDDALKNRLKVLCDSKNPKLVSDKNEKKNVSNVDGKVNDNADKVRNEKIRREQDNESQMNGKELLLNTGECGWTSEEEDPNVIGSQGRRGSCRSHLEDHQLVSQQNCLTHAVDTFRTETAVNKSAEAVNTFHGSFSDFGSGNMNIHGGEETSSDSLVSGIQDFRGLPEEQSDKKSCAFEGDQVLSEHKYAMVTEQYLSKLSRESCNYGSQDSADPILIGLTCTNVEKENSAFPTDGLDILSSEENFTRNEGDDNSDLGDSELHTSKKVLSSEGCKNIHECLRAEETKEEMVSETVSSIEQNGKDATEFDGFDVRSAQAIAESDTDMIAGQVFCDDMLLHPAQDHHSVESPDILDKASTHLKFALSCNETLKLVVSGTPESLNGSSKLSKEVHVSKDDFSMQERDKCYDNPNKGSQVVKIYDSKLLEDSHKCDLVNFSENLGQKNHSKYRSNGSSEGLLIGVAHSQSLDGKTSAELCNNISLSSLFTEHCRAISAEKLEQSDKPAYDYILPGQGTCTVSEESERNQVLGSVPELSDACGSEAVSSGAFNLEPLMGEIDTKMDSFDVDLCMEDKPLDCVRNNSLPKSREVLTNSVLPFDTQPNGKSACSDIDSASQTSKACISRASSTCIGLVENNQESSRSNDEVNLPDQTILGDESEMRTSETINSPASKLCLELDNAKCSTSNEYATVSIKRPEAEDGKMKSNLTLIPPRNAVPFSDEWLAAIEAAGEDILTMKGGAVQNSPPDKSQPEPSPWSPVKKKNNQAGPYDCTKFMRNQTGQ